MIEALHDLRRNGGAMFRFKRRWACFATGAVVALAMVSAGMVVFGPLSDRRTLELAVAMCATAATQDALATPNRTAEPHQDSRFATRLRRAALQLRS